MNFSDFQNKMREYPVFARQDLRMIFPKENHNTVSKQLYLWNACGKITKLKNGLYILGADYAKEPVSEKAIAYKLYSPSYISMEYALSAYGLIPEAVFDVTSITPKTTRIFKTPMGFFRYRSIKPFCFFGFSCLKEGKLAYCMADPEKALLDYLYFNSDKLNPEFKTWESMRIMNLDTLKFGKLAEFAEKFRNKKLISLIINLKQYAKSN